jgi:hypothetical protein
VYNLMPAVRRTLAVARARYLAVVALCVSAVVVALPSAALAVESEGETKIKAVATQVGTEGTTILLLVLGALAGLIALVIILPKAVHFIKRFI